MKESAANCNAVRPFLCIVVAADPRLCGLTSCFNWEQLVNPHNLESEATT
jgi:hypothetical protein